MFLPTDSFCSEQSISEVGYEFLADSLSSPDIRVITPTSQYVSIGYT